MNLALSLLLWLCGSKLFCGSLRNNNVCNYWKLALSRDSCARCFEMGRQGFDSITFSWCLARKNLSNLSGTAFFLKIYKLKGKHQIHQTYFIGTDAVTGDETILLRTIVVRVVSRKLLKRIAIFLLPIPNTLLRQFNKMCLRHAKNDSWLIKSYPVRNRRGVFGNGSRYNCQLWTFILFLFYCVDSKLILRLKF